MKKLFLTGALMLALTSSGSSFHLKKKLVKAAGIFGGASFAAPALADAEIAVPEPVAEPVYYQQAVQIPAVSFIQPSVAYIGVKESIPSSPAFNAGLEASLQTTRNGVVNIASYAKEALVNSAKAIFDIKSAIGSAVVLPFSAAFSGVYSAAKTYHNYRFETPLYRFVPEEALIQSDVVLPAKTEVAIENIPNIKDEIVGPSGYIVRYGNN